MNNAELNQFARVPTNQTLKRSIFDLSHSNKFTAKVGKMIPFECIEIYPGDTFVMNQSQLLRSLTPVFPTMDNAFVDFFYFFVPNRICYADGKYQLDKKIWEQINGENTKSYWAQTEEVEALTEPLGLVEPQSIFDYLGLPLTEQHSEEPVNVAPAIAVGLIWNEFVRDQNLQAPIVDWESFLQFARTDCLDFNKFHDYFTSALPAPQKGEPVAISIGQSAPITGSASVVDERVGLMSEDGTYLNITHTPGHTGDTSIIKANIFKYETIEDPEKYTTFWNMISTQTPHDTTTQRGGVPTNDIKKEYKLILNNPNIDLSNAQADLSKANAININDLRLAFATQKMLERDARSGTRFIENLKARWNITIKDETLQRPQYIGGKRIPLNISEVNQTSATDETSPLGRPGAVSKTSGQLINFTASFKEQGYLIGIMVIRLSNTYKAGIPLMFSRKNRLDYYNPEFANIGEQPIKNKELYLSNDEEINNQVFGYKEPWSELRYCENKLKGKFKDTSDEILNAWTYSQNFEELPTLNEDFLKQTRAPFLKTLSSSETEYDYIVDIWENISAARPLPTFSIPSLIDHN